MRRTWIFLYRQWFSFLFYFNQYRREKRIQPALRLVQNQVWSAASHGSDPELAAIAKARLKGAQITMEW